MSSNTKKSTQAKRISVSYESQQETLIMSILALYGIKFVVSPPRKSCSSCQFIDIKKVIVNGREYDFENFIEHYIVAHNKTLSKSTPHYNKYQKRNQTAATNNVLTDMLKDLGWKVSFRNSKEATITLKMERINVLSCNGVVLNGDDIAKFGEKLNQGLKSFVSQSREASLVIGQSELPIESMTDMTTIPRSYDLVNLHKMFEPVNVSIQIGEVIPEEIETGNRGIMGGMMNYYNNNNNNNQGNEYENEERRNEIERYVIECSRIMEEQNQSQNVTQSCTGSVAVPSFGVNKSAAWCAPAADVMNAHHDDEMMMMKREKNDMRDRDLKEMKDVEEITDLHEEREEKMKEEEQEKYDNELPPSTNVQPELLSLQSFGGVSGQEGVKGYAYVFMNGGYYLVECILPPTTPTVYCPQQTSYYGYQGNETVANASTMVEGALMNANEESCGFNEMTNFYSAV